MRRATDDATLVTETQQAKAKVDSAQTAEILQLGRKGSLQLTLWSFEPAVQSCQRKRTSCEEDGAVAHSLRLQQEKEAVIDRKLE